MLNSNQATPGQWPGERSVESVNEHAMFALNCVESKRIKSTVKSRMRSKVGKEVEQDRIEDGLAPVLTTCRYLGTRSSLTPNSEQEPLRRLPVRRGRGAERGGAKEGTRTGGAECAGTLGPAVSRRSLFSGPARGSTAKVPSKGEQWAALITSRPEWSSRCIRDSAKC